MKRTTIFICLILSALLSFAQGGIEAKIDPIEIMIGEQAQVTLSVHAGEQDKVEWPTLQPRQLVVAGVEVIAAQHPEPNVMVVTLTSFDAFYSLASVFDSSVLFLNLLLFTH